MTDASSSVPPHSTWVREQLPLVLTIGSLALVTLRIGMVAGFEATAGYALIARGSPFLVLVSTLFDLVPTALVILAVGLTVVTLRGPEPVKGYVLAHAFIVWLFVVFAVPLDSFLAVAAGTSVNALGRWPMRRAGTHVTVCPGS